MLSVIPAVAPSGNVAGGFCGDSRQYPTQRSSSTATAAAAAIAGYCGAAASSYSSAVTPTDLFATSAVVSNFGSNNGRQRAQVMPPPAYCTGEKCFCGGCQAAAAVARQQAARWAQLQQLQQQQQQLHRQMLQQQQQQRLAAYAPQAQSVQPEVRRSARVVAQKKLPIAAAARDSNNNNSSNNNIGKPYKGVHPRGLVLPAGTSATDFAKPLFVDCSIEYDLPNAPKIPRGSQPILMIHPAYAKRTSAAVNSGTGTNVQPQRPHQQALKRAYPGSSHAVSSTYTRGKSLRSPFPALPSCILSIFLGVTKN